MGLSSLELVSGNKTESFKIVGVRKDELDQVEVVIEHNGEEHALDLNSRITIQFRKGAKPKAKFSFVQKVACWHKGCKKVHPPDSLVADTSGFFWCAKHFPKGRKPNIVMDLAEWKRSEAEKEKKKSRR